MSAHEWEAYEYGGGGGFVCQAPVEGYREFQTPVKKIGNQKQFAVCRISQPALSPATEQ